MTNKATLGIKWFYDGKFYGFHFELPDYVPNNATVLFKPRIDEEPPKALLIPEGEQIKPLFSIKDLICTDPLCLHNPCPRHVDAE